MGNSERSKTAVIRGPILRWKQQRSKQILLDVPRYAGKKAGIVGGEEGRDAKLVWVKGKVLVIYFKFIKLPTFHGV